MTTMTTTTTRGAVATSAAGAATILRGRYATIIDGSDDHTASTDAAALAEVLETAAAQAAAEGWTGGDMTPAELSWSTTGANDPTTRAALLAWLEGGAVGHGLGHGTTSPRVRPDFGDALAELIGQL